MSGLMRSITNRFRVEIFGVPGPECEGPDPVDEELSMGIADRGHLP